MTARENYLKLLHHEPIQEFMTLFPSVTILMQPSVTADIPLTPDDTEDAFGCKWIFDKSNGAFVPDPYKKKVLEDICDWRNVVKWPDVESMDWEAAAHRDGADKVDRENTAYCVYTLMGPFERLHILMGFENALCALLEEPEEVAAFFDRYAEYKIAVINKIARYYKPDVIQFQDDAGTALGTFYSPEVWKTLVKPVWKKLAQAIHDNGIPCDFHCCGKNTTFFEDLGDTCIDGLFIQPINDLQRIRAASKGKLALQVQMPLDMGAIFSGKVTVGELRRSSYEFVSKNIKEGYGDFIPVMMPPIIGANAGAVDAEVTAQDVDVPEFTDDMPVPPEMVHYIVWNHIMAHADDFTKMIQKRNMELGI